MLPAYCSMMAITAHILPHLGDGPLWPKMIWEESEICKKYWWINLFFITNFLENKYGVRRDYIILFLFNQLL